MKLRVGDKVKFKKLEMYQAAYNVRAKDYFDEGYHTIVLIEENEFACIPPANHKYLALAEYYFDIDTPLDIVTKEENPEYWL